MFASGIKDHSYFDYDSLYSIFASKSETTVKKSTIEQFSILINDRSGHSEINGTILFREKKVGKDVFSIAVNELLEMIKQTQGRNINILHPNELNYIQELIRFVTLSFLFYPNEVVVADLLLPIMEIQDTEDFEASRLFSVLEALKVCLGCKKVDMVKNALRCLQVILLKDQM